MSRSGRIILGIAALVVGLLAGVGPAGAQQKIQFRIASVVDASSTVYVGTDYFKKRVEELTGGKVEVVVYKGTLGKGERQLYEAMQLGTLEGAVISTGPLSGFVPEADLFNLPFLFKNTAHAFKVVDGETGAWFNEKMVPKGFSRPGLVDHWHPEHLKPHPGHQ